MATTVVRWIVAPASAARPADASRMPIPTDTFRGIKRLNWVFAISGVLLFLATFWSIIQDWDRNWRIPQRGARVWEAALTKDKIDSDLTPEKRKQIDQLRSELERMRTEVLAGNERYRKLEAEVKKLESDRETIEFGVNTLKSNVAVLESYLQDARTAGDSRRVEQILREIEEPAATLSAEIEKLAHQKEELADRKSEMRRLADELDRKLKELNKLYGDAELLQKKLDSLAPSSVLARLSEFIRNQPLLGFINPSERVQQVVLPHVQTDVAFMKITTVDRCATCHTNIQKNDFTEANVLAYLEAEAAKAREVKLPLTAGSKAADPVATVAAPGPVPMINFWHAWARQLGPEIIRKNAARLRTVTNSIGNFANVTYDGSAVVGFTFDPNLDDTKSRAASSTQPAATTRPYLADPDAQNEILLALIQAWYRYGTTEGLQHPAPVKFQLGKATVEIANVDKKMADPIRGAAMRYAEELENGLRASLDRLVWGQLEERYRWAMVDVVNAERTRQRLPTLDPSPVYLAHSELDLYASQDSPHPMDGDRDKIGVGCTSCHDGSGQETDFVLAAHVPRRIWVDAKTGEPVLPTQLVKPPVEHHEQDLSDMLAAVYPPADVLPDVVSKMHFGSSHDEHPTTQPMDRQTLMNMPAPDQTKPIDYVDPATGRRGKAVSQAEFWRKTYEPISAQSFATTYHYWDWPMRPPQYIQSTCVRCHTDVFDIKDHAPIIYEGRQLFTSLGCVNCHQMDSIRPDDVPAGAEKQLVMSNGRVKVGTDLRHVTSKLAREYINTWIWAPKAFRPTTKMPHFFLLENNSSDEEIRRTRQEARAITEYLVRTATPLPIAQPIPADARGSAEAGHQLFNTLGCLACHNNLGDATAEKRDGKPVTVGEKWITTDLTRNPQFIEDLTVKLGKTPSAADLLKEARAAYDVMTYNQRQLYVQQNLSEPMAQSANPDPTGPLTLPKYPDGTPKPIFVQIGPELSGVGTKLTTGRSEQQARQWLFDWLKEPRHYSQYTIMPKLRLSDQQALDLAEYLLAQTRAKDDPKDEWNATLTPADTPKLIEMTSFFLRSKYSPLTAYEKADDLAELRKLAADALKDLEKNQAAEILTQVESEPNPADGLRMLFLGQKLIAHYGCMSCHAINGTQNITSPCTNLSDWGQKGIDKLDFGYLDHHKLAALPTKTKIPMVNGLSPQATLLLDPHFGTGATASSDPHAGTQLPPGMSRDIEVAWPHVGHNRVDWITRKLTNTRVYDRGKVLLEPGSKRRPNGMLEVSGKPYEKLKMPTFYLNQNQADAIVTFVISNRDRLISDTLTARATNEQAKLIARGRELTERYNCISCHQIELAVPQIQQYAKPEDITEKWPPSLRGEGNKIQHGWLFNFFRNVEPLRPLLINGIRMPSFSATDDEFRAIVAYFNAASKKESSWLNRQLDPIHKLVATELKASNSTTQPSDAWPTDDAWWMRQDLAMSADELKKWALVHGLVKEIELDPTKNTREQIDRTYKTILFKARFVKSLYDAPFPFVEAGRPEWSSLPKDETDKRFKLGEQFFYEMQCLKCHVLGDPSVQGAQKNPTAPNLSLAYQRLQRRWVRDWVQEPAIIQLNTKMPPFLTGLDPSQGIYRIHGLPWPRSQGAPEADVQRIEAKFGKTVQEQTKLALDFLYEAGARGYTGVQPASAEPPATRAKPQEPATQPATTRPS